VQPIGPIKPNGEVVMPVRKVKGGYKWGTTGKVYPTKEQAERQGKAAYASGYKSKKKPKK